MYSLFLVLLSIALYLKYKWHVVNALVSSARAKIIT